MTNNQPVIEVNGLKLKLGDTWVHNGINLKIYPGEILGIVGGSGSGKTTLLREILMLQPLSSGSIKVFGNELTTASSEVLLGVQKRWGVLFQQNALFSSLTVLENCEFPLKEKLRLDHDMIRDLALLKIQLVGLPLDAANKYPAELSGGMQKRAALARALVLDPELLFLDEPTAGLDPDSAGELDDLILKLKKAMNLTVVLVTHDLDSLWHITDRVAFLADGKVLYVDELKNIVKHEDQPIKKFFNGPRGRIAQHLYG